MGKVLGILLIVGLIWVGLEIYTEGAERAFGGLLASPTARQAPAEEGEHMTLPQRARADVEGALREEAERRERLLGE
jgi:hypothetical protein